MAPRLRPLGIGEILDVGIKIYTRNWLTLWKIVVFVVLPAQILVNVVEISAAPSGTTLSSGGPRLNGNAVVVTRHQAAVLFVGLGVGFLITFLAAHLAQAGCLRAIADAYLGEEPKWRSSLRYGVRRLPAIVVLSIVSEILIVLGAILCVVPGIYLWAAFYVTVPVLLVEGVGPFRALGRSRRLVKGRWWGTFGVAVIGYLLVAVVTTALTAVVVGIAFANPARNTVTGFALNTLASTIGSMLTTPAAAAFATVLYIDLRVRKEGFDLLLLAQRLGVERPPGEEAATSAYLPEAPVLGGEKPPFWPPPPGWKPEPSAAAGPDAEPPSQDQSEQPPFWPPPPGWRPGQQ